VRRPRAGISRAVVLKAERASLCDKLTRLWAEPAGFDNQVRELKVQGLGGASEIAKALKIGRASVHRLLETGQQRRQESKHENIIHCRNLRDGFGGDCCTIVLSLRPTEIRSSLRSRMASQQGRKPSGWQD